jgi:hypothetical protein
VYSFLIDTFDDLLQLHAEINEDKYDHQEGVPESIAKPIFNVKYNPEIKDVYIRLTEIIGDRAHLFIRPISNKVLEQRDELFTETKEQQIISAGLEGNLIKFCEPDSSTYNISKRLLQSSDIRDELITIENEYLKGTKRV